MVAHIYISLVCGVAVLVCCGGGVQCTPPYLAGDFDSQLRHILHAQMRSAQDPVITRVIDDVRATLDQRWEGYELIPCGSLGAGIGTISSDIDLVVQLPNFNTSASSYLLEETAKSFNKQPELYTLMMIRQDDTFNTSFLSIYHIPTNLRIEIEFDSSVAYDYLQDRDISRFYFELDKRFKPLVVFLKYWFKTHGITGHGKDYLTSYALYSLIIFYLQQKNLAPPVYMLQVYSRVHNNVGGSVDDNELPYSATNTENLHQLLGGFFKYYSEFNFEECVVSPFIGRPIPKNTFTDIVKFSKKYALYKNTLNRTIETDFNNDIGIQDMNKRDMNSARLISHERATKFKYLMKSVATMFEELPSDRILSAILVMDDQKEITQ